MTVTSTTATSYDIVIVGAGKHNRGEFEVTSNKATLTYLLDSHRIKYTVCGRVDDPDKKLDRIFINVKDADVKALENFLCDALLFKQYKYRTRFTLGDVRKIMEQWKLDVTMDWEPRYFICIKRTVRHFSSKFSF